ncbi:hypothetical protein CEUSTIGMA_g5636.t1 [Chlamydomonas eustigma]|uniref:Nuclease associated modular domain-containing protein n=1 Tax=Chlamydomonas eustigma TaxID=1157962 RepID=A0A250X530_9CHLO|nr:hypothetical protein CEUSTIGMA_g5636.t1 [Chlamydomonas eustigma]|eukprot:GAX78194.1 hypothetical protein CEUSTIGMA_g5636.t1 [Chlamydomonas eustigma]
MISARFLAANFSLSPWFPRGPCIHSRRHIPFPLVCHVLLDPQSLPTADQNQEHDLMFTPQPEILFVPLPHGSPAEELDEKEIERRRKISEANSGRKPWNTGRKHSPETIAKIRAKTAEAMQRPEVVEKFKAAVQNRGQKHSEETKAKIGSRIKAAQERKKSELGSTAAGTASEEKESKPKRTRKPRQASIASQDNQEPEVGDIKINKEVRIKKERKSRAEVKSEDQPEKEPKIKKRERNSVEHKEAIAEAIRAKWQDPEYRAHMVQRMREAAQTRAPPRKSGSSSSPSSGSGSRTRSSGSVDSKDKDSSGWGSLLQGQSKKDIALGTSSNDVPSIKSTGDTSQSKSSSRGVSKATHLKQQKEWLEKVQVLVDQLIASQRLLTSLDMNIIRIREQARSAFVNDAVMSAELEKTMHEVTSRRDKLIERISLIKLSIPPMVEYDEHSGKVTLLTGTSS